MSIPIFVLLMVACCGYALARGGAPERIGAGLQIAAYVAFLLLHFGLEHQGYRTANFWTFASDVVLLVALVALADRSTRFWPLWVAGWQLAAIIAHLAKVADPDMKAAGYAIQSQIWAYPMLIATAAGAWRHRARRCAGDPDPAWKDRPAG